MRLARMVSGHRENPVSPVIGARQGLLVIQRAHPVPPPDPNCCAEGGESAKNQDRCEGRPSPRQRTLPCPPAHVHVNKNRSPSVAG
jgi:hypothetical protein